MSKKLTITELNQRLSDRGIEIIGEYKSRKTPTDVRCLNGHVWSPAINNLLNRKDGCPLCSGHSSHKEWTTSSINDNLKSRGITMTTEYTGKVKNRGSFKCEYDHSWTTTVTSVLRGRGCKICYGKTIPLTLEVIQERYEKFGYTVSGTFTGHGCKLTFNCSAGHTWIGNSGNTRCSSCAKYGFSDERKAHGYIIEFENFIKYGISNSIDSRLCKHRKTNPPHKVVAIFEFVSGTDARRWENAIKSELGGRYVDKNSCPDGWTETLPIVCLQEIIEKYDDFVHRIV